MNGDDGSEVGAKPLRRFWRTALGFWSGAGRWLPWTLIGVLIVLVDHDVFRVVPLAERAGKVVYDTRGIWPDQPKAGDTIKVTLNTDGGAAIAIAAVIK